MHSIIKEVAPLPAKKSYPYLGIRKYDGDLCSYQYVVMFVAPTKGVVVATNGPVPSPYRMGHFDSTWIEESFEPFYGAITLAV